MLFNSRDFLIFFPIVVFLFFTVKQRHRNILLLAASYYFYMCWKPAYIVLIITSTLINYFCSLRMSETENISYRKLYLTLSIVSSLGILFVFKYLNFFAWTTKYFLGYSQIERAAPLLNVLLPVGISFYTFQTLSYTIDVYRGETHAEKRLINFALYVSFFPQLVAGPIERSTRLLPQFDNEVKFDYHRVTDGLKLMLWGMFKKVVIADTLAKLVNPVYGNPANYEGPALTAATIFFAFQIYCDFSGYSDIAIGAAEVLGIELMQNFDRPYSSKSIREFWRRWHISLSTWFRDYLYIPLGGNRVSKFRNYINLTTVFFLCGLWHGANWTFVIWGLLHGSYMIISRITETQRAKIAQITGIDKVPIVQNALKVSITFGLTCFAWIFFRAQTLTDAWYIIGHIPSGWDQLLRLENLNNLYILNTPVAFFVSIMLIMILETAQFMQGRCNVREMLQNRPIWLRWSLYYIAVICILLFGSPEGQDFIYFQF